MSANERQIGGAHYAGDYQHWDWVVDVRLPYHPANATKYVTRSRKKNGLQDLEKALHYIDKTIEINKSVSLNKLEVEGIRYFTARFASVNELSNAEGTALLAIALGQYTKAKDIIALMVAEQSVS